MIFFSMIAEHMLPTLGLSHYSTLAHVTLIRVLAVKFFDVSIHIFLFLEGPITHIAY